MYTRVYMYVHVCLRNGLSYISDWVVDYRSHMHA